MTTHALHRSSFSGMHKIILEGSFQECQTRLIKIADHYENHPRYSHNRDVQWLEIGRKLEITDEGFGLIGDDCGIYAIEPM